MCVFLAFVYTLASKKNLVSVGTESKLRMRVESRYRLHYQV